MSGTERQMDCIVIVVVVMLVAFSQAAYTQMTSPQREQIPASSLRSGVVTLLDGYPPPGYREFGFASGHVQKYGDLAVGIYRDRVFLVASSGRIADLGPWLLADVCKRQLTRPGIGWGQYRPDVHQYDPRMRGATKYLTPGNVYLLETRDKKMALVRVLSTKRVPPSVEFQYLYQPDGSSDFAPAVGASSASTKPTQSQPAHRWIMQSFTGQSPTTMPTSPLPSGVAEQEAISTGGGMVTAVVSLKDTATGRGRSILRFADGSVRTIEQPDSLIDDFSTEDMNALKRPRLGDLFARRTAGEWRLFTVSPRIVDLGPWLINDVGEAKLFRPPEAYYCATMLDLSPPLAWDVMRHVVKFPYNPGATAPLEVGNTYLAESADGKYALVRVLSATSAEVQVQFLYQPDGSLRFSR